MKDGVVHYEHYDAGIPAADLDAQWDKLVNKFRACVDPVLETRRPKRSSTRSNTSIKSTIFSNWRRFGLKLQPAYFRSALD